MTTINSPSVINFIEQLKKYNIDFREHDDNNLSNVVMSKPNFSHYKITHEQFFRVNGKCVYTKDGKTKNTIEILPLTDNLFYNEILAYTLIHFKIDKF